MSTATSTLITEPGVYDLADDEYFADPVAGGSLSSTGARALLPPSCPAKFDYERHHPRPSTKAFDFGHAAHQLVLGAGPKLVKVAGSGKAGPNTWATNADKDKVAEARDSGAVPLKPADWDTVHAMAAALKAHPFASLLFTRGHAEKVLVWRDEDTSVMCRAKVDWLPDEHRTSYLLPDYKSAVSVEIGHLGRAVHNYGYYVQAPFYLRGIRALGIASNPAFLFVAQEKEPPYLVTVFQLTPGALAAGDRRVDQALRIYADCTATGVWPGYATDIEEINLPAWATREDVLP